MIRPLENLSLKVRMGAVLVIVVGMTVGLGAFTLRELDVLANVTTMIYEHPLQVTNASLRANGGVTKMNLLMEMLTSTVRKLTDEEAIAALRDEEAKVYENLDIVRQRILGAPGQALERETRERFANWRPVREQIVKLVVEGDRKAAAGLRAQEGLPYAETVQRKMEELTAYARNKADGFAAEANAVEEAARRTTIGIVAIAALLSSGLLFFILRSIVVAVSSLKGTMAEIAATGRFVKSDLEGRSELAEMARHFNALIGMLQNQFWLREGLNELNRELSGNPSYDDLLRRAIAFVARTVGACAGALYSFDAEEQTCELRASYAFVEREHLSSVFRVGHGIVGQVAVERQPILLRNIKRGEAEGQSGTVSEPPRCIYALPLVYDGVLHGILEVASFEELDGVHREFLDAAGGIVANAMYTALQAQKIRELLAVTQASNEALQAKTDALNAANEEMKAVNEELQSQSHELQAQTEELKAQALELSQQQARLQEADRLKSEFLSNMSHELRTPLNSVLALSQLMISRGAGKNPEQEQEYLKVIERNGRQLLSLINDILDLSKIESGRMEMQAEEFDPRELARRVVETVDPLSRARGLSLTVRGDRPARMLSDEDRVRQILLNLVSNAVKFTERGSVTVSVDLVDQDTVSRVESRDSGNAWVRFTVRDTGIGIEERDLAYIFDEFRQVDGSTTRRHEGTGLGLAICQKLARLLGGSISVESEPGVGSTFTLSLPVEPGQAAKASPARAQRQQAGDGSAPHPPAALPTFGETVLVIDDEEEVREAIRAHLETGGFRVVTAKDGGEGLELARQLHPSAITLDLMMPGMDGWEVISRLKAFPATADIPVVIVSVSEDRATGAALGASGYVLKPLDREVLVSELTRLAGSGRVRRVLVVDDDPVVREQLSSVLGERGYRVVTASGGAEGLALARLDPPDAVLLDLMMPEMDGFTVLDRLRSEPATSLVPVVVLTAKDLTAEERQRLGHSAQQVLAKGREDRSALLERLDRSLRRFLEPRRREAGKPLILVVEDNPVATLQIRSALEDAGYAIVTASGGAEALERVTAQIPDAVVLDLMMPDVDGFQVLEQIRSTPRTARLPVLVLTAKELTADDRARLTHNHVQELVQKGSLDRAELVATVGRVLRPPREPEAADASAPGPATASAPRAPLEAAGTGAAVILLVEDNADNRFTISAILDELGCRHESAPDGAAGLAAARRLRPGLILMDVQLPGLSGLDATRQLKADPALQRIPVVALTAKAMKGDREAILAAGCDDYLAKPVDPEALAAAVRRWMRCAVG